ncbi:Nuclear transport factor 2 [Apostasia shenzhenica]|uniref:Nuclear transport factor 2 n=1 Tax=Apostasia shenzhenica TaxID=1088818 RepID=A0A2I0ADR2_9ASPA|nr:Nuclear transport factor 2 [Apostasia shenzhenica]
MLIKLNCYSNLSTKVSCLMRSMVHLPDIVNFVNLMPCNVAGMALSGATQPSPQVVGAAFVQQYYCVLHQSPDQVHKFYQESSILGRPDSSGTMTSVTTTQAINDKLLSLDFNNYTAQIESADSQASYKNGVLVVVTGSLIGRDNVRRKFTQSFFLAPQERGGYVVLNDIFRFVDPSQSSDANQVLVNGAIDDVTTAAQPPESETSMVQATHVANAVEHESVLPVENPDYGEEVFNPLENDTSVAEDGVAADPEVHLSQSDELPVSEVISPVSQEDGPKKSYASIVKVYKGSSSPVPNSTPISKPKPGLTKPATTKSDKTNAESQPPPPPPSKSSSASEATVPASNNVPENNLIDVEGYSIYIRNLPLSATAEQVEEEFKKFGPIKPGGVQVDRFCFGFVEFESLDSMRAAIKVSSIPIGGRRVYIEEKRTTTRGKSVTFQFYKYQKSILYYESGHLFVNGVVTNSGSSGDRGRYQLGRGAYRNENYRSRGGFVGNQGYGRPDGYSRQDFRGRGMYSGRGRGGPSRPLSSYQQRSYQNGNGRVFRPSANQATTSAQ